MVFFLLLSAAALLAEDFRTYRVKKNDTLYSIARKFGVHHKDIRNSDGKNADGRILAGQILKIPVAVKPEKKFRFPASKARITRSYSPSPRNPFKGILMKSPSNTVLAADNGKVMVIDTLKGYEKYIIVTHSSGFASVYGNMEKIFVKEGQTVDRMQKIGKYNPDKGLYFQLNYNQEPLNPVSLLN